MTNRTQPECIDLNVQGIYSVYIEVFNGGHKVIVCPCCDGDCEHSSHPGNNPQTIHYQCDTCQGEGHLKILKEHSANGNPVDRDKNRQHAEAGPLQR